MIMISLILRLLLRMYLLCSVLLGGALMVGTTIPATPIHGALLAHNSCALPCFDGIIPGLTSRDDAMKIFERAAINYGFFNEKGMTYTLHHTETIHSLLAYINFGSAGGANVSSVQIYQMPPGHELGILSDFLGAGYQPTQVFSSCQDANRLIIALGHQGLYVQVALDSGLDLATQVLMVGIAAETSAMTRSLHTFGCGSQSHWLGFAASWKYQAAS